jgi:predicted O-methyltransferase YrrM
MKKKQNFGKIILKSVKVFKNNGFGGVKRGIKKNLKIRKEMKNSKKIIEEIKQFDSQNIDRIWKFVSGSIINPAQDEWEFKELLKIIKKEKPKIILEIGSYNGGTLFSFSKLNPNSLIISIDLPEGNFSSINTKWKTPIFHSFGKNLKLIQENSHNIETLNKVKRILSGKKIDFMFIDGDHTYEGVKKDFEMYYPLLKKGGIVAFHDISRDVPESNFYVHSFWKEISNNQDTQELINENNQHKMGIGVLKKLKKFS